MYGFPSKSSICLHDELRKRSYDSSWPAAREDEEEDEDEEKRQQLEIIPAVEVVPDWVLVYLSEGYPMGGWPTKGPNTDKTNLVN